MPTRGVVYVHSTPLAVCPHVEWAIARVLSAPVNLHWSAQPVEPGAQRAECSWSGRPGTGAELAAALRQWPMIRYEVTEEPSPGVDGQRFMHVPNRGLFSRVGLTLPPGSNGLPDGVCAGDRLASDGVYRKGLISYPLRTGAGRARARTVADIGLDSAGPGGYKGAARTLPARESAGVRP